MDKNIFNSSNNDCPLLNRENVNNSNNATHESTSKNKFNFKEKKENTLKSLSDIECFLRDFHKLKNYIKLYKILK